MYVGDRCATTIGCFSHGVLPAADRQLRVGVEGVGVLTVEGEDDLSCS